MINIHHRLLHTPTRPCLHDLVALIQFYQYAVAGVPIFIFLAQSSPDPEQRFYMNGRQF